MPNRIHAPRPADADEIMLRWRATRATGRPTSRLVRVGETISATVTLDLADRVRRLGQTR